MPHNCKNTIEAFTGISVAKSLLQTQVEKTSRLRSKTNLRQRYFTGGIQTAAHVDAVIARTACDERTVGEVHPLDPAMCFARNHF